MVQAKRQSLISAKENTLVSIANFCKQTVNVEIGYSDRLSAMFSGPLPVAESNFILIRRFAV